jgi:FAD/FMN-containing dehydrogenase
MDPVSSSYAGLEKKYHLFVETEGERDSRSQEIWEAREGISVRLGSDQYTITEDPLVPLDRMAEFLDWLSQRTIPSFGHIAFGIIHPRFKDDQKELISQMCRKVIELGGQPSGEPGYGISKKDFLPQDRKVELRGFKMMHDPKGVLNKGKVI